MIRDAYGKIVTDDDIHANEYVIMIILWEKDGRKFRKKVGGKRYKIDEAVKKLHESGASSVRMIESC